MEVAEDLIGKKFPVLDDGHVVLLDVMGDDGAVVDAARTTMGKGTRRVSDDRTLIRYLYRHNHGTPFEMAEIKLHVRVPMDCWRQWIRHRTANVNEYSTRYSEAIDSQQRTNPSQWRLQAATNRQGSTAGDVDWPDIETMMSHHHDHPTAVTYLSDQEQEFQIKAQQVYEERLRFGVAREQARKDLPLSTYTEAVWKCDLRNVLHFLGLRMDSHAQHEIRQYANVIGREIVAKLFPLCWEAFEDYTLGAMTLSRLEIEIIRALHAGVSFADVSILKNQREWDEFKAKAIRLGIWSEPTL
jgi:thymidylate synthase (FAD)